MPLPCLALVTDRGQCRGLSLEDVVRLAVEGGANLIQLREKDLPSNELRDLALRLRTVTLGKALLVINTYSEIALEVEADGVHLPEAAPSIALAREASVGRLLLGRSVHSVEAAVEAELEGADYLQVGTIFATPSKPGVAPAGLQLLASVREKVSIPVLAVGGINAANARDVVRAGAGGVAVISAILASPDPRAAAKALRGEVEAGWAERTGVGVGRARP